MGFLFCFKIGSKLIYYRSPSGKDYVMGNVVEVEV